MHELQRLVAETSDRLGLHSTAPNLLLDLQARLGGLSAEVLRATQHGRRPFRPQPGWDAYLGELAFAIINLADQTGIDLDRAVRATADQLYRTRVGGTPEPSGRGGAPGAGPGGPGGGGAEPWPFSG